MSERRMRRIVLDTNVLVSSAYDELSASWQIIEAVLRGELKSIVSDPLQREYEKILERTVQIRGHEEQMRQFLALCEYVDLRDIPRVVHSDPQDDKVIATARAGRADALITNDRHLLDLGPYEGVRILRPVAFEHLRREEHDAGWRSFAHFLGLSRP